jgi:hypothetical protein
MDPRGGARKTNPGASTPKHLTGKQTMQVTAIQQVKPLLVVISRNRNEIGTRAAKLLCAARPSRSGTGHKAGIRQAVRKFLSRPRDRRRIGRSRPHAADDRRS